MDIASKIQEGKTTLGIELGSTRIKAVLVDDKNTPIASGSYEWASQCQEGIWTYAQEEIIRGIQSCYGELIKEVKSAYQVTLTTIGSIGFSAMMHGYLAFDKSERLLVPFRTWQNTMTMEAADALTKAFDFNIPQRWSIAHLYQAILNKEEHVKDIAFLTTLAGYIHWQLTGEKVLGIGDASGMFPIDSETKDYDQSMIAKFDQLVAPFDYEWKLENILPKVLMAGERAGVLTEKGARLLDVSGQLKPGIPLCPPEGDAGTGMVATNSVAQRTGNVSAGTSVFAMIVLENKMSKVYPAIDMVTTPSGDAVAMVHCNNCTSDINAWVRLFKEFAENFGIEVDNNKLFSVLFNKALEGDADCGGLLAYNYFSGESITGFEEGRPLFVRSVNNEFNLANFMRVHLLTALGALKNGLDLLIKEEKIKVDQIVGHGGFFKTKEVGQRMMAAAVQTPVTVMETAGEGGAWGIAVLASYMMQKQANETLTDYLGNRVFDARQGTTIKPEPKDVEGFEQFMKRYNAGLAIERAAVNALRG